MEIGLFCPAADLYGPAGKPFDPLLRKIGQLSEPSNSVLIMPRILPLQSLIFAVLAVTLMTGCVQRRLIVRSNPEGAFVSIDNQSIGYTPLSVPYTYSGTRDIKLEKDGFKTVQVSERIRPRWFDTFPVSLVTNNFWFREIRDERLLDFQLEPKAQPNEMLLRERAEDLRANVDRGTVTAPIR